MTMMGLDIQAIEHLDFEYAPPCEQIEDCGNEAEWIVTPACCGQGMDFCTPCKDTLMEGINRGASVIDSRCKSAKTTILSIDPLH